MSTSVSITRPRTSLAAKLYHVRPSDLSKHLVHRAHKVWRDHGGPSTLQPLITEPRGHPKARKSTRPEYVMHLAPHRLAGVGSVCPWSTPGCRTDCLYHSGRGSMESVQRARIARTRFADADPVGFLTILFGDIMRILDRHTFDDHAPLIRLNGTSDIAWEDVQPIRLLMGRARERYGVAVFTDYTKADRYARPSTDVYRLARSLWPDRYNATDVAQHWGQGDHVSVVVTGERERLIRTHPRHVADASATDEWLLSGRPTIGALAPLNGAEGFDAEDLHEALAHHGLCRELT